MEEIPIPLRHPLLNMYYLAATHTMHSVDPSQMWRYDVLLQPEYFPESRWLMKIRAQANFDSGWGRCTLSHTPRFLLTVEVFQLIKHSI